MNLTIHDIAEAVGVSQTTVSNVINGNHKRVSQKTIDKVNKVIEETGYIPNKNARALANNRSKIIGVIFPESKNGFMQDPFHSSIVNGVEKILSENNYYMMMKSIKNYEEIYTLMKNWSVEGFIILSLIGNMIPDLSKLGSVPVVFVDTSIKDKTIDNIGTDDYQGEYDAASYLLQEGHKSIGYITYTLMTPGVLYKRFNGFKDALTASGIEFNSQDHLLEIPYIGEKNTTPQHNKIIHDLQAFVKDKTALCFSADILAIEAMEILKSLGYSIPEDLSIMGFDDIYLSRFVTPKLTTMRQDIVKKGTLAAERLIEKIERPTDGVSQIEIHTELVIRDSVKKVKCSN